MPYSYRRDQQQKNNYNSMDKGKSRDARNNMDVCNNRVAIDRRTSRKS